MKAKETIFFCHFVVIFSLSLDSCDCVEFVCEVATTTIIYAMWRLGYPNLKETNDFQRHLGVTFITFNKLGRGLKYLDRCQLLPPKTLTSLIKIHLKKIQSKKDKGIIVSPPLPKRVNTEHCRLDCMRRSINAVSNLDQPAAHSYFSTTSIHRVWYN